MTDIPNWTRADAVLDVTDAWNDIHDPQNERGAVVLAYLNIAYYEDVPVSANPWSDSMHKPVYRVEGISIETLTMGVNYFSRTWCVANNLIGLLRAAEAIQNAKED